MKKISALLITSPFFFFIAQNAFADSACPTGGGSAGQFGKLCNLQIGVVVGTGISFVFIIAALIALGYLVYGGLRWITSGGDKTNVESARQTIVSAVIGLVIIFLSYVILNVVLQFFFGTSLLGNFTLPTL